MFKYKSNDSKNVHNKEENRKKLRDKFIELLAKIVIEVISQSASLSLIYLLALFEFSLRLSIGSVHYGFISQYSP